MRKKFICGNWKMNKTAKEAEEFARNLLEEDLGDKDILIAPTFTSLYPLKELFKAKVKLSAQNLAAYDDGAYTGEVSARIVKEFCDYVIIGHSERRNIFLEDDEIIRKKIKKALENNLKIILCLGEDKETRKSGGAYDFVKNQILTDLKDFEFNKDNLTLAYEPIWAIGSGEVCNREDAQKMCAFIRETLGSLFGDLKDEIRILYGGSVKGENAKDLLECPDIDGALVGGASLKADEFLKIINYKEK
ncbi:triose-phosphate isomerase [Peptoniphilus raoultii]|uniref:triose-phosphate isomerase n=1 Tax=Peptoniphilus raoultii TaxID=1776387 RepID=UPI0008DA2397|nr:triose-phosphate isomerase [Peptoniphilus raoultii]